MAAAASMACSAEGGGAVAGDRGVDGGCSGRVLILAHLFVDLLTYYIEDMIYVCIHFLIYRSIYVFIQSVTSVFIS